MGPGGAGARAGGLAPGAAGLLEVLPDELRAEVGRPLALLAEGGAWLAPGAELRVPLAEWAAFRGGPGGAGCTVVLAREGDAHLARHAAAALRGGHALFAHVASRALENVARGTRESRGWRDGDAGGFAEQYGGADAWTRAVLGYFGLSDRPLGELFGADAPEGAERVTAEGVEGVRLGRPSGLPAAQDSVREDWLGAGPWEEGDVCIFERAAFDGVYVARGRGPESGGGGDALPGRRPALPAGPGVLGSPPLYRPGQVPVLWAMALPGALVVVVVLTVWRARANRAGVAPFAPRRRSAPRLE